MNKRTNKPIYDVFPRKAPFFGRFLVDEVYPFGFAFISTLRFARVVDEVYPFGFAFISTLRFARVVDELRSSLPFASLGWLKKK